jgi:molecular chaperone GrpE
MGQNRDSESQGLEGNGPGTPSSIEDRVDALNAEVEEVSREKNQFREMFQRAQADFINYKRRTEEDRDELQKHASSRLILKLLPVMDEFNLAIDHASQSDASASWLEGIKLIERKLNSLLESEVVTRIEVEDKEFDPLEHEAMAYQESGEHREGQILSVVRDGYKMHGRVIRPALVILAKRPETSQEETTPTIQKET